MNINFVSVEELADLLERYEEISFTFDSCLEDLWHGEPTGWYGIKIIDMFDCQRVVGGYYGGNDSAAEGFNYSEEYMDAVRSVMESLKPYTGNIIAVCVDMDGLKEKK